jgi:hypothetical protein
VSTHSTFGEVLALLMQLKAQIVDEAFCGFQISAQKKIVKGPMRG